MQKPKTILLPHLLVSTLIFILFIYLGTRLPSDLSNELISQLKESISPLINLNPLALLAVIFLNNAFKCLLTITLGILLGLPSLVFICFNAVIIGLLVSYLASSAGPGVIVASLLPHGIIELPVLITSTALGLSIGLESFKFITRQASETKIRFLYGLRFYFKWILILLLVAAAIEVFITPQVVSIAGGTGNISIP